MAQVSQATQKNEEASQEAAAPLAARQIQQGEVVRNVWCATPAAGSAFEELAHKGYWAHVAAQLRAGDIVEICPLDRVWYAKIIIGGIVGSSVSFATIEHVSLKFVGGPDSNEFSVEFLGSSKWSVKEKHTGKVIRDGYETQAEAFGYVLGHTRTAA